MSVWRCLPAATMLMAAVPAVVEAQCDPVETVKLTASDGAAGDYFGLPVAQDMKGQVLEGLFLPEYLQAHPQEFVDTWQGRVELHRSGPVTGDARLLEDRLRDIGYIDDSKE